MRDDKLIEAMRDAVFDAIEQGEDAENIALAALAALRGQWAVVPKLLNTEEMAALRRVHDCFEDGAGWDVPAEMMKRLARIGVVRWCGGSRYEITEYGDALRPLYAAPQREEAP